MSTAAAEALADQLDEAWSVAREVFTEALRDMRHTGNPDHDRFDAYLARVFDEDDRMLGMQSVGAWIGEMILSLRSGGATVEDDGE